MIARGMTKWLRWLSGIALTAALLIGVTSGVKAQDQSGITSPAPGSAVNGDVPILGTAVIDPFQKYELHYKQEPSGNDAYIYFGGGTNPVVNGQLGVWQAGGLPPGAYSLRLRVVKADGNYAEFYTPNLNVNGGGSGSAAALPTPTLGLPTETPIPTATFTPAPQPTAAVGAVEQPQVEGAQVAAPPTAAAVAAVDTGGATPTPTLALTTTAGLGSLGNTTSIGEEGSSLTRELGAALSFDKLRDRFWSGVRYSVVLCLGVLALFGGKRLFDWVWTQFR
ncbi:MAG TPA: hypothetical protein PKE45_02540 [Caldilineaceae bacterium]|nr:hypothetical protein [Caldilineaceae bacterium]